MLHYTIHPIQLNIVRKSVFCQLCSRHCVGSAVRRICVDLHQSRDIDGEVAAGPGVGARVAGRVRGRVLSITADSKTDTQDDQCECYAHDGDSQVQTYERPVGADEGSRHDEDRGD